MTPVSLPFPTVLFVNFNVNILSGIHADDASLPSNFFLTNKVKRNETLSPVDRPE